MTFAPNGPATRTMPSTTRTILFWSMMIVLAVVLWQMASKSPHQTSGQTMSYSDFMDQVDKNNVATARLYVSPSTAEIQGELRQPAQSYKVTSPKEVIPELTERLRKQGARVDVSGISPGNWQSLLINVSPLIVLIGIWIFMLKRVQGRAAQTPPGEPANRPL